VGYFVSEFPEDLFKQLNRLENSDEICRKMLRESVPILAKSLSNTIKATHVDTGDLYRSIEVFEPRKTSEGIWVVSAGPSGKANKLKKSGKVHKSSKSGRKSSGTALWNSDKLFYLEYGTSKQAPSPIMTKATNDAEQAVIETLQEVFNREVDKS
jgi:HK97 gp10 family phage protein